jgi:hypothetical protein
LIQSSWITSHSSINLLIFILINIFKSHNIN